MKTFNRSQVTNRPPEVLRGPVIHCPLLLIAAVMASMMTTGLLLGCHAAQEGGKTVPERAITAVMNENVDRIMALDEVVMVAIGELTDGTPCIQVHVKYKSDILAEEIGSQIEGHPVDYIISDEIRPMN